MKSDDLMTAALLSRVLGARLRSKPSSTTAGPLEHLLFQLLRRADQSTSMAWHGTWRDLESIPWLTPC